MKMNRQYRMLNDETFLNYALKHYEKRGGLSFDDLVIDLKEAGFINQSLKRYDKEGKFNIKRTINSVIVAYNTFSKGFMDVLFYKTEEDLYIYLVTLLYYMGVIDDDDDLVLEYGIDIKMFNYIEEELEKES